MIATRFEPPGLEAYPTRTAWDAEVAEITAVMLDRWHLVAGQAFTGGEAGAALAVTQRDGTPAVLKIGYPHHEAVAEALALEAWSPVLAPRVLRQDPWTWALLLERVDPGVPLSRATIAVGDAIDGAAALLRMLHATEVPPGVPSLGDVAGVWLREAARGSRLAIDAETHELVVRHLDDASSLLTTDRGTALLHGDFNPGNVLWSEHPRAWLAIDPKPMTGDAEFDLHPLVQQVGGSSSDPTVLEERLGAMAASMELDIVRSARWCAARCALDAVWAADDGDDSALMSAVRELRVWSRLSDV